MAKAGGKEFLNSPGNMAGHLHQKHILENPHSKAHYTEFDTNSDRFKKQ